MKIIIIVNFESIHDNSQQQTTENFILRKSLHENKPFRHDNKKNNNQRKQQCKLVEP